MICGVGANRINFGGGAMRMGGSGAKMKAGFSRSIEMDFGLPLTSNSKVFSPRLMTLKGPVYGGVNAGLTASVRMKQWLDLASSGCTKNARPL